MFSNRDVVCFLMDVAVSLRLSQASCGLRALVPDTILLLVY